MSVMCLSDGSHWPATTAEYQKKKSETVIDIWRSLRLEFKQFLSNFIFTAFTGVVSDIPTYRWLKAVGGDAGKTGWARISRWVVYRWRTSAADRMTVTCRWTPHQRVSLSLLYPPCSLHSVAIRRRHPLSVTSLHQETSITELYRFASFQRSCLFFWPLNPEENLPIDCVYKMFCDQVSQSHVTTVSIPALSSQLTVKVTSCLCFDYEDAGIHFYFWPTNELDTVDA